MNTTLELSELDRKIGQLFMAGIPGYELDGETEALIRDYNLGGIILFARNIQDPTQQTVDALMKLDLSPGVDVEIKL